MTSSTLGLGTASLPNLHPLDRLGRALVTTVVVSLAGIWIIFLLMVRASYIEQRQDASDYASNVAALLAADLGNIFETYGLSLQELVADLSNPDVMRLPDDMRRRVLYDSSSQASLFGAMVVVDSQGLVVSDSRRSILRRISVSDRDYFLVQRDNANAGLFISRPYTSRITGEQMIGISHRLEHEGRFDGIALGTLKVSALRDLFARVRLPAGSKIALLHQGRGELTSFVVQSTQGAVTATRERHKAYSSDGSSLVIKRPVPNSPLEQIVSIPLSAVLTKFWQRTSATATGFLVLSGLIIWLGVKLTRELQRRTAAEASLYRLATTDALTGLTNRGRFDELLLIEVKRNRYKQQPLALLMIDVDYFKAFNDTYGHSSGDAALRAVADVLSSGQLRRSDVVARIGGEEFAILLPATDRVGAQRFAARILESVRAKALSHIGSPLGVLSVSIGLASCETPDDLSTPEMLYEAADAALYRAKHEGRNTVRAVAFSQQSTIAA